jgi:GGDEF domain-containing protein/GAF domain-containing protein
MGLLDRALNYKKKKKEAEDVTATVTLDEGFEFIEEGTPEKNRETPGTSSPDRREKAVSDTELEDYGELETIEVRLLDEEPAEDQTGPAFEEDEITVSGAAGAEKVEKPIITETIEQEAPSSIEDREGVSGDFMLLYEIEKEISKAETREELYDYILFTLMGQLGTSSSSLLIPDPENNDKWIVAQSSGVTIDNEDLFFEPEIGILKELISRKNIIDIEEFKDNRELLDEYINYISIDTRLMTPLIHKTEVMGVAILGDKITTEEYNSEDRDFLMSVGEISAIALHKIIYEENLKNENSKLKQSLEEISDINNFRESVKSETSIKNVNSAIMEQFRKLGLETYAIFIKHRDDARFYPEFTEEGDRLSLKKSKFTLKKNDDFIRFINKPDVPIKIDNFRKSDLIRATFKESQIHKAGIFRVYPFLVGNNIQGFIILFNLSPDANLPVIDKKLAMITEFLFYHIQNIQYMDSNQSSYIDNVEIIFKRIEDEISNSRNLGIPLTIALLSIKNYRRYYSLYGHSAFKQLLEKFEDLIKTRLSDNDFSLRYGRHKILIVLPGKDKKFAVPLVNTLCQEITGQFNNNEMQLLLTTLTSEFPKDGEDLYSLMDKIEL